MVTKPKCMLCTLMAFVVVSFFLLDIHLRRSNYERQVSFGPVRLPRWMTNGATDAYYDNSEEARVAEGTPRSPLLMRCGDGSFTSVKFLTHLKKCSRSEVMQMVKKFNLNGTEYFSFDTAKRFLTCHLLMNSKHIDRVQLDGKVCKRRTFRRSGRLVALASFPGSGNTWTRTLLEQATGVYTGSIYRDESLVSAGFEGECLVSRNVIAVKTHGTYEPGVNQRISVNFDSVIYIIRNLYDALVSEYSRRRTKSHVQALSPSAFGTDVAWNKWVTYGCSKWINSILTWLYVFKGRVLVVQYENLKTDLGKELRHMLKFLNHEYIEEDVACVLNNQLETFHRHRNRSFNPFTPSQANLIQDSIKKMSKLFLKHHVNYTQWISE